MDQDDVRRIALALPETEEATDRFGIGIRHNGKLKKLAWVWLERLQPKRSRVPNPTVLAVRVAGEAEKRELVAADPRIYFTEPHYDGYPAVLVRLAEIDEPELTELLLDAWRAAAPPALQQAHRAESPADPRQPRS
ncbi:MAG: hypothetical protein EPO13_05885 [Actinomycetota bacterium]|nr:MAG: hypothetical protein EPO13_05885 [Actinomycetota bacterium]